MLMGAGLLSKFVELVASKLIGKHLDLALDEKRRACYTLVELYSILQGFSSIAKGFASQLEDGESWIAINLICRNDRTIKALTTRFFDLHEDLLHTLEVMDPTLASVFERVHSFKGSIFFAIEESIIIPEEEPRNSSLRYRHPTDRVLEVDMDAYYHILESFKDNESNAPWIWPEDLHSLPNYEAAFTSIQFKTGDRNKINGFVQDLKRQADLLDGAIEKMRILIKENFTLDEVLSASRRLPDW
jgi:hypothetical protein